MKEFKFYQLAKHLKPRCPHCFRVLVPGEKKRYETLEEHVFDPNMTSHPLRPTLVCSCEFGKYGYWNSEGSWYTKHENWREFHEKYPPFSKRYPATYASVFSFDWFHAIDMWFYWKFGRGRKLLLKGKQK